MKCKLSDQNILLRAPIVPISKNWPPHASPSKPMWSGLSKSSKTSSITVPGHQVLGASIARENIAVKSKPMMPQSSNMRSKSNHSNCTYSVLLTSPATLSSESKVQSIRTALFLPWTLKTVIMRWVRWLRRWSKPKRTKPWAISRWIWFSRLRCACSKLRLQSLRRSCHDFLTTSRSLCHWTSVQSYRQASTCHQLSAPVATSCSQQIRT